MKRWRIGAAALASAAFVATLGLPGTAFAQAVAGHESFTIFETGPHGGPVFATGAFTDAGTDVEHPTSAHTGTSAFLLGAGTINVSHIDDKGGSGTFNPATCTGTFHGSGDFVVTGGTGAYKGISGGGEFTVSGSFINARTAKGCSQRTIAQFVTIHAEGTVTIP